MQRYFLGCTPRTGNTWLRKLVAAAAGLHEAAAQTPPEIEWENLPPASIVAMHWHYSRDFAQFLRSKNFSPVVITRHPLDVLLSILQFSPHEPATAKWLGGEGGDERLLAHADPTSQEFLEYALSARAALLLGISAEWARHAVSTVRYERLVQQPEIVLASALHEMGRTPISPLADVVAAHTLEKLKIISRFHFWRGCPGLWRTVLTAEFRRAIARRHADLFEELGYDCDWPTAPSPDAARDTWRRLCEGPYPMRSGAQATVAEYGRSAPGTKLQMIT